MAHLFSIQFDYQGISHNALVNVRTTPFFTEYHLGMLNEDVLNQLPGNKILSSSPVHYVFANHRSTASKQLMNEIIGAISEYVHATQKLNYFVPLPVIH